MMMTMIGPVHRRKTTFIHLVENGINPSFYRTHRWRNRPEYGGYATKLLVNVPVGLLAQIAAAGCVVCALKDK